MNTFNGKDININYYHEDNNSTKTIIFIHGFSSSHRFCESLFNKQEVFNIISIDIPTIKTDANNYETLYHGMIEFINSLNNMNSYTLVGHSFGATFALRLLNDMDIFSKALLFAPLHPYIQNDPSYKVLNMFKSQVTANPQLFGVMESILKMGNQGIQMDESYSSLYSNLNDMWKGMLDSHVMNPNYLNGELTNLFMNNSKNVSIIGSVDDPIIKGKFLHDFITQTKNIKLSWIDSNKHNVFKDNMLFVDLLKIINSFIGNGE